MFQVLADVAIQDVDLFLQVFGTRGLEKRREHGCRGAQVLVPADEAGRVLVLLDWDDRGAFEAFTSDPGGPPIMRSGGAVKPPVFTAIDRIVRFDH